MFSIQAPTKTLPWRNWLQLQVNSLQWMYELSSDHTQTLKHYLCFFSTKSPQPLNQHHHHGTSFHLQDRGGQTSGRSWKTPTALCQVRFSHHKLSGRSSWQNKETKIIYWKGGENFASPSHRKRYRRSKKPLPKPWAIQMKRIPRWWQMMTRTSTCMSTSCFINRWNET